MPKSSGDCFINKDRLNPHQLGNISNYEIMKKRISTHMNMVHKFSQHVWQNAQKHGSVFIDTGRKLAGVTARSRAFRMPGVPFTNTDYLKYQHG